ncbi:MAG: hypothetical protein A3J46_01405 [Candidatus Yanofskybacteria bacterium RIFCSPHIGHO2_02_FULL_41_11]|uniref:Nucleotidyl transferase AbiEii/AbiGii toxin family protein n=1 Tax=Candidatus Yanofskybacteria bacterium RIFCSPHIGHO2_02_FULL_41_11 TaxID=1802675 RepID=A0A1F8F8E4_9BACT|nr:MAG: hypothetical protein A3J46_01405 [Candidatus Yanofskybacteria bacterium RIFCSPHIGHO2_02_FULL_41_11]
MRQEALTNKGQEIFSWLENFKDYYLAGGTALALQIGHRISVDFDLFYSENIPKDLLRKIKTIFKQSPVAVSVNNPDELSVFIDGTKISFIKYPFPVLLPFVEINSVKLLSVKELAATKSYTIGRRGSFKDYVDLFFILQEGHSSLEEILDLAEKKYGEEFNGRLFLEQLTYTQDVEDAEIILLKNKSINKKTVFDFLYQEVGKIKI